MILNRLPLKAERENPPENAGRSSHRILFIGGVMLAVLLIFIVRLWQLQILEGGEYQLAATLNRLRVVPIEAPRGLIYDRHGRPLVRNVPSFEVAVVPAYLPDDEEALDRIYRRLSELLEIPVTNRTATTSPQGAGEKGIRERVNEGLLVPYEPVVLKRNVDRETAMILLEEALTMPGVYVQVAPGRAYPTGPLTASAIGYVGRIPEEQADAYEALGYDPDTDLVGLTGIEYQYEKELRGSKGRRYVEENVQRQVIRTLGEPIQPVPGHNVVLTLDLDLQRAAYMALRRGMEKVGARRGVVIAMNPQTGEVLALVSLPTYDNNLFTQGIPPETYQALLQDPHHPFLNHAIGDQPPPGSTFKIVTAAAALQEGVIDERTIIQGEGVVYLPNKYYPKDPGRAQKFVCWIYLNRGGSHGPLNVVDALAQSCDIFFYKVGGGFEEQEIEGLGIQKLAEYARLFGLGEPTGIDLPAEAAGLVPDPTWKRRTYGETWSTGDTYNMSIGQGFLLATPLQILNATAAVANGGILYRPQLLYQITDVEGNVLYAFQPQVIRQVPVSPENLALVRQGMEAAVAYGTAQKAQVPGIRVAGKTGTAEFFCGPDDEKAGICRMGPPLPTHAWFTAFAPVEKPEIALVVWVFNGGEGSATAAPIAQEILSYYFQRAEKGTGEGQGASD